MMADQFKNEIVGEVSSPTTEEKITAPERKEPVFAAPQAENAPVNNGAEGASYNESAPKRKLPVFREDIVEPVSGENMELQMPSRREPIIKERERKLPVFADEVKKYAEEDEFGNDDDFTSDSISIPFTLGATTTAMGVDVSEATSGNGKKKKKKGSTAMSAADLDKSQLQGMDQYDELARLSASMSSGYPDFGTSSGGFEISERFPLCSS